MDAPAAHDDQLRTAYAEAGFAACPDAAPSALADEVRALFLDADYDRIEQVRRRHYGHVQKMDGPLLPGEDEVYRARFSRSGFLERHALIKRLVEEDLLPLAVRVSGRPASGYELRAYRMDAGDLLRLHVDDYVAEVGFIYYLSTQWRWDWGGILTVVRGNRADSVPPVFNQLVVINHGLRLPHFVSQITDYALQPRYMLVGLCR
jgi:Rps23 Pro-64 3,4-dihydroxylase Tpa1-like proline 4-hydroxylase